MNTPTRHSNQTDTKTTLYNCSNDNLFNQAAVLVEDFKVAFRLEYLHTDMCIIRNDQLGQFKTLSLYKLLFDDTIFWQAH